MKDKVKKWMEEDGKKFLKEIGIKKGQTVLDFGSGSGHYTIPLSNVIGQDGKVYALDKNQGVLDELKKKIKENKIKNVELIEENLNIPLKSNFLDTVLCYDIIHYESKNRRDKIYKEVNRVLKKNALFSIYPKHYREDSPLDELADMDLEDIIKEVKKAGFSFARKFSKVLLHDETYNRGYILNFRRVK